MRAKKIFDIPIYALTKDSLQNRVAKHKEKLRNTFSSQDEEVVNRCIDLETYPQRLWEYNHIVGFIKISLTEQDVCFDVYLPTQAVERYMWKSKKKHFLYNISATGTHFYVSDRMSNQEIQARTAEMLDGIIKCHVPGRFYVGRSAFDILNRTVDYKGIMKGYL